VLIVAPRFPPYIGGIERHLAEVAPRLVAAGMDVTILTTDPSRKLPRSELFEGVPVRRVRAVWADYYFAPGVFKVITEGGWDLVHLHSYQTLVAPIALSAALRARLPYVVTLHSGWHSSAWRNAMRGVQLRVLRPLLHRAARLVAVSQFELELFSRRLRIPPQQFVLIPNGAQMPDVRSVARDPEPLILSVGRLEKYKGHHRVLAALPHLVDALPNVKLRIVGTGPHEPTLRRLVKRNGLEGHVEIGRVAADDPGGMAQLLARASVVVLMSEYESHGIAMMEAIAVGRPVMVAYNSALMEYADRGYVRAVPLDISPHGLAEAIVNELRDPLTPPPLAVPSWDDCATSTLQLYQDLAVAGVVRTS
jgi:glycosyltransferase involved in cell wall biosynthesis